MKAMMSSADDAFHLPQSTDIENAPLLSTEVDRLAKPTRAGINEQKSKDGVVGGAALLRSRRRGTPQSASQVGE
jgi:hypothetical protein